MEEIGTPLCTSNPMRSTPTTPRERRRRSNRTLNSTPNLDSMEGGGLVQIRLSPAQPRSRGQALRDSTNRQTTTSTTRKSACSDQHQIDKTPAYQRPSTGIDPRALPNAPNAPRQTRSPNGGGRQRAALNPNERLGNVPDNAERFPVEGANDHIVWAFFRSGQYWRKVEAAAKDPYSFKPHQPNFQDVPNDWVAAARGKSGGSMAAVQQQRRLHGSYIIVAGGGDKLIKIPTGLGTDHTPRGPSSFTYEVVDDNFKTNDKFSVTVVGESSNVLALWKKDTPFYQTWQCRVNILAVPCDHNDSATMETASSAQVATAISTVRIEWTELLLSFLIAFTVLLLQTAASYLVFVNSKSVSVDDVAKSIESGFISFTDNHGCNSTFQCAEDFKASQRHYDLSVHDLFHGPNSPGVCLTADGYWNALFNIAFGTLIIQVLVIRDAHMFWCLAPMNMVTHEHLTWARWVGFLVLFCTMLANYGFLVVACFYGILGASEDFAALLGACTTAFVLLEIDDVVYKLTAEKFFRAEHSARPGSSANDAVHFYRTRLDFEWRTCLDVRYYGNRLQQFGSWLGVVLIVASNNVVLTVVALGPWLPMLMHWFVYQHGFLYNTSCTNI